MNILFWLEDHCVHISDEGWEEDSVWIVSVDKHIVMMMLPEVHVGILTSTQSQVLRPLMVDLFVVFCSPTPGDIHGLQSFVHILDVAETDRLLVFLLYVH